MLQWVGIIRGFVGAIAPARSQSSAYLPLGDVTNSVFSGSQGFLVLIAGLVLAFAFQLLLANFFIALGISYSDSEEQTDESETLDDTIDKIGTIVGLRNAGNSEHYLIWGLFFGGKTQFS